MSSSRALCCLPSVKKKQIFFPFYNRTIIRFRFWDIQNNQGLNKGYTLFFYKNVVFPAQAEYSYFSADFRLKIFLYYS